MNYNGKSFRVVSTSEKGEVSTEMIFTYFQRDDILTCTYRDKIIQEGHLIGKVDSAGKIHMHYHQINDQGKIMTGVCISTPEILPSGKIRLYEDWRWTSGAEGEGKSILDEI